MRINDLTRMITAQAGILLGLVGRAVTASSGGGSCSCDATPAAVKNLSDATDISAGTYHALAVEGGVAQAWGFNDYGELGNGSYGGGSCNCDPTPAPVKKLTKVTAVAAGEVHSLALQESGAVSAWGYNNYDALGNGIVTMADEPEPVNGLPSGVVALSAGQEDSMALTQSAPTIVFKPVKIELSGLYWFARFSGTVDPEGAEVSACKVEYGLTTEYGHSAPCSPSPGSGETPVEISAFAEGLASNTTYHYRLVATNAGGTTRSSDETLTTDLPTATISSPASGGSYVAGTVVDTRFSCAEAPGGPGLESCTDSNGTSSGSGTLATSLLGAHTYTVTAKSKDGQVGTAQISYRVTPKKYKGGKVYDFCGSATGCGYELVVYSKAKTWTIAGFDESGTVQTVKIGKTKYTDFHDGGCVYIGAKTKAGFNSKAAPGNWECEGEVEETWYAVKL